MGFMTSEEINFETATNVDIVNHILKKYHAFLKKELPAVEELVFTIFRVHFNDSGEVLEKVHRLYGRLKIELESHMIKEERALFHMIKDYKNDPSEDLLENIIKGINSVEKNDSEIKNVLRELRRVTDNYTIPSAACPTYVNTYNKIEEIEKETMDHLKLEEDLLFKRLKDQK